ncbi:MAG: PaaI family thioesterase [Ignavibacteriae bacterium]|nr:PaaI family thioesterase [Ignavibacteriota bacterium]MCB9206481.1 PaaI family thioesterase [Ignavibacteriales bacterium]MCB9219400.1 PaaI family thioesterase [Ignavibacteriales bacterium]MCB9259922.1 PaaI family thioesterase [Ignavibacteriales bacterium]
MKDNPKAFQEFYSNDFSHCYGCGTNNEFGHKLKTYWDDEETVSKFVPRPEHTALPGFVYGGLIASLIDCHSTGSGSAALYRIQESKSDNYPRCVTASLKVDYLKPTPIDCTLELRGKIKEVKGRKVIVETVLFAKDEICAKGEVIVVQVPDDWKAK